MLHGEEKLDEEIIKNIAGVSYAGELVFSFSEIKEVNRILGGADTVNYLWRLFC